MRKYGVVPNDVESLDDRMMKDIQLYWLASGVRPDVVRISETNKVKFFSMSNTSTKSEKTFVAANRLEELVIADEYNNSFSGGNVTLMFRVLEDFKGIKMPEEWIQNAMDMTNGWSPEKWYFIKIVNAASHWQMIVGEVFGSYAITDLSEDGVFNL